MELERNETDNAQETRTGNENAEKMIHTCVIIETDRNFHKLPCELRLVPGGEYLKRPWEENATDECQRTLRNEVENRISTLNACEHCLLPSLSLG